MQFSHTSLKMQTAPPKDTDPNRLTDVLHKASHLRSLCAKNELIRIANALLLPQLPEPLRQNCFASNIEHRQLTLTTDSATWANPLRYQQQLILDILHREPQLQFINRVKVRIQPPIHRKPQSARRMQPMSIATSQLITGLADSVKSSRLKQALRRLAKNTN